MTQEKNVKQKNEVNKRQKTGLRQAGLIVLVILIVLLFLEFAVASVNIPGVIILIFAGIEAAIILWEYMHVSRFFRQDDRW